MGKICHVVIIITIILTIKFCALNNILSKFIKEKLFIVVGDIWLN